MCVCVHIGVPIIATTQLQNIESIQLPAVLVGQAEVAIYVSLFVSKTNYSIRITNNIIN